MSTAAADGLELVERERTQTQGQKLAQKALDSRIAALERRIARAEAEIAECRTLRAQLGSGAA